MQIKTGEFKGDKMIFQNKTYVVFGVANKKSVAYHICQEIQAKGGKVICSVKDESMRGAVEKILPQADIFVCDVEKEDDIMKVEANISSFTPQLDGMVHSIAFANFSEGLKPFHETLRKDFLQAMDISCFSFIALSNALKNLFTQTASIITISISSTRTTAQNYGYMAPIKAALDSSVAFLAKSFSEFSKVRFNSVNAGLLKTSASAGIPGYIDSYLFAEQLTLRKQNLATEEVASTAAFLLSDRSSGINAQNIIVDAGMGVNSFDEEIVRKATR